MIFVKVKQEPRKAGEGLSPTTTLMHRGTLGESSVFRGRGMSEEIAKQDSKGAQDGKTPLGLWQPNRTDEINC